MASSKGYLDFIVDQRMNVAAAEAYLNRHGSGNRVILADRP